MKNKEYLQNITFSKIDKKKKKNQYLLFLKNLSSYKIDF